jgi:hypothetical protein
MSPACTGCPGFRFAPSGLQADVRHRPCSHLGAGLAVLVLFLLPIGACGTLGERPRPRRPHVLHASTPYDVVLATSYGGPARRSKGNDTRGGPAQRRKPLSRTGLGSRSSPAFRTRMDLFGLLDVPGMAAYASVPPFVRAVARTCTRAVRPLRRGLPRPRPKDQPGPRHVLGPTSLRTSASRCHVSKTTETRPLLERDGEMIVVLLRM